MATERTTLVISLGSLDALDEHFARLEAKKRHPLHAVQPWHGDVLLAAYGPKGSGDLYVFAGVLFEPARSGEEVRFAALKRFWHPVVAIYRATGIHRADLIGDIQGWSPTEHFYVMPGAAAKAMAEAEASLRHLPERAQLE